MPKRPPQWSINATAKRIEFDDSKFVNAVFRNYGDDDLCKVFGVLSKNANIENIKVQVRLVEMEQKFVWEWNTRL